MAVLILLGFCTAFMFIVWLTSRLIFVPKAVPVQVIEDVGGGGGGGGGAEQELEEPPPEETKDITEAPTEESLTLLTQIVNQDVELLDATAKKAGKGFGTGMGDGRGAGPGGPGTMPGIPAWERWEVRLSSSNINDYAAQLDFFKIELGVAGGGSNKVDYINGLSRQRPIVRSADAKNETRLRFLQRSGPLREADRSLAQKAGVNPQGRVVFQFYPKELYDQLLLLENQHKGTKSISDVRRTIFGVQGKAGAFSFKVLEQEYRAGS